MRSRYFLFFTIPLIVFLNIYFLDLIQEYPEICVSVEHKQDAYIVDKILAEDCEGYRVLQLQEGDRILQIDGHPPSQHPSVMYSLQLEQFHTLTIEREGKKIYLNLETSESLTQDRAGASLLFQIICWMLAFATLLSTNPASRHLFVVFVWLAIPFMSIGASTRAEPIAIFLMGVSTTYFFYSLLHFFNHYFHNHLRIAIPKMNLVVLYAMPTVVVILDLVYMAFRIPSMHQFNSNLILLVMVIGFLWTSFYLIQLYRKHRMTSHAVTSVLSTIIFSLALSFIPIIACYVIPTLLFDTQIFSGYYLTWFVLILPFTFLYLIFAKKMVEVSVVVQRIAFSVSVALIPGLITLLAVVVLFGDQLTTVAMIQFTIIVIAIFAILLYVLEYSSEWLENILYPHKSRIRNEMRLIFSELGKVQNIRQLKENVFVKMKDLLHVEGVSLNIENNGESFEVHVPHSDHLPTIETEIPLLSSVDYRANLLIGRKQNKTAFTREEQQAIRFLSEYLTIALKNIYLVERLTKRLDEVLQGASNQSELPDILWLRQSIFLLQERERERLSSDIHDTSMQDLMLLKRKFTQWSESQTEFSAEIIHECIEDLDMINISLREICFSLHPNTIGVFGLIASIEQLIQFEQGRVNYSVQLDVEYHERIEQIAIDTKTHLFRIVQELLNNAHKHAVCQLIHLSFTCSEDRLKLEYRDDGIGLSSEEDLLKRQLDSGSGWLQITNRVQQIKGDMQVFTRQGQGLQVVVSVKL